MSTESGKRNQINRALAAYFLSLEVGSNLDSVRALADKMRASIGLISEAISHLESLGGVTISRHGQLGSTLQDMSIGKLWDIASGQPLVLAHTLPSNRRYEGLATAIKTAFQDVGIDNYFIFIRGSRTRVKALREQRCHIAITSQFAAQGLITKNEKTPLVLPAGSFVHAHHLYVRKAALDKKTALIVAVDPDSYDQITLSEIEFEGRDVVFKHINFMNIFHYLSSGEVDAAVWTEDDMRPYIGDGIVKQSLSLNTREITRDSDQHAALIIRKNEHLVARIIEKVLRPDRIIKTQNQVIRGKLIPEY